MSPVFVPPSQLAFDLAAVMEQAIAHWETTQPLGFTRPVVESCGDFIVAEMESSGLRRLTDEGVCFNSEAPPDEFRECVFAALDHWLIKAEISTKRTAEEMEEYRRPCGE